VPRAHAESRVPEDGLAALPGPVAGVDPHELDHGSVPKGYDEPGLRRAVVQHMFSHLVQQVMRPAPAQAGDEQLRLATSERPIGWSAGTTTSIPGDLWTAPRTDP
jgi:hypothetical protein